MEKKFRFWSKKEENDLIKKIRDKIPIETISTDLNRSKRAITMRLNKIMHNLNEKGSTIQELSLLFDMKESEITEHISSHNNKNDDSKDKKNNLHEILQLIHGDIKSLRNEILELKMYISK